MIGNFSQAFVPVMCLCFERKQLTEITESRLLLLARQSTEPSLDAMVCLISASLFSIYLLLFLIIFFFICGSHTSRQCEGNALKRPSFLSPAGTRARTDSKLQKYAWIEKHPKLFILSFVELIATKPIPTLVGHKIFP